MIILYLDFLCPKRHLNLDRNQISRLSNIADVVIISQKGRYKELPKNVTNIESDFINMKQGKVRSRISSLKIMIFSAMKSRKINYDYIIVSSFETMMFAIGKHLFKRKDKFLLFHHFNTDEISSKTKALFFRTYKNKVIHVVFSGFIKEYLMKEFDINSDNIFVMPHHMNKIQVTDNNKTEYRCVGLSNSNNEKIIEDIIRNEGKNETFKKNKIKVILKSKKLEFDNGYLKVVKGFLEKDVFDSIMEKTQAIYMPFPFSFRFRMSGTLIDALTNSKIVYGSDIPVIRQYSKDYPHICRIVNNADDFIETLRSDENNLKQHEEEFEMFKKDHSEEKIELIFKEILNNRKFSIP